MLTMHAMTRINFGILVFSVFLRILYSLFLHTVRKLDDYVNKLNNSFPFVSLLRASFTFERLL